MTPKPALTFAIFLILGTLTMVGTSRAQLADPTGVVTATQVTCEGAKLTGQVTCYQATVSCPNLPDIIAQLRVLAANGPAEGSVMYGTGGLGNSWFESVAYGATTMETLASDGFTGVEYLWPATGWQADANGTGVRAAGCRYATLALWVSQNFVKSGTPMCATGNSAGAFQIANALAHYGASAYITDAELTSGPPFTRVDYACINDQPRAIAPCSGVEIGQGVVPATSSKFIDPAYGDNRCSSAYAHHVTTYQAQFLHDSVTSRDADLKYPATSVYFILGGKDTTSATRQAMLYEAALAANGIPTSMKCVADAPHVIESVRDGAQAVVEGIVGHCKLPPPPASADSPSAPTAEP